MFQELSIFSIICTLLSCMPVKKSFSRICCQSFKNVHNFYIQSVYEFRVIVYDEFVLKYKLIIECINPLVPEFYFPLIFGI